MNLPNTASLKRKITKQNQQYHQNQKTLTQKQADLQQLDQKAATEQQKWEETKKKAEDKLAPIEEKIKLTEIEKTRLETEEIQKKIELQREKNAKALKEKELQEEEKRLKQKEQEEKDKELQLKQAKTDKERERIRQQLSKLRDEKQQIVVKINRINNDLRLIDSRIRTLSTAIARIERLKKAADERLEKLNQAATPLRKHIAWADERIEEIKKIRQTITKRIDEIQIEKHEYNEKHKEIMMLYQNYEAYKADNEFSVGNVISWGGEIFKKTVRVGFQSSKLIAASIIADENLIGKTAAELEKEFASNKPMIITKETFENLNQAIKNRIEEITTEERQLQQRLTDASFDRLKDEVIMREDLLDQKLREQHAGHRERIDEINERNAKRELAFINSLEQNKVQFEEDLAEIDQSAAKEQEKSQAIRQLDLIDYEICEYENELTNTNPNINKINDKILNKRGINITFTKHHDPNTNTKK